MGGQDLITGSVGVALEEEDSPNNITKFCGKLKPPLTEGFFTANRRNDSFDILSAAV